MKQLVKTHKNLPNVNQLFTGDKFHQPAPDNCREVSWSCQTKPRQLRQDSNIKPALKTSSQP